MSRGAFVALLTALALVPATPTTAQTLLRSFDPGGLEARSAALILSGQEGGALPVTLHPLPEAVDGDLPFLVEIDGRALLEADDGGAPGDEILLEVHAYLVTDAGELAGFATRALRFAAADAGAAGDAWRGIRYLGHLPLGAPGDIPTAGAPLSLRVLVLQRAADRFGLRLADVEPAGGASEITVAEAVPDGWWLASGGEAITADDRLFRVHLPTPEEVPPGEASVLRAEVVLPSFEAPEKRRKLRKREIEALRFEYWRALRALSEGDRERAFETVTAFEAGRIADGAREQDLIRGQLKAAEALADVDPESLPPLIRLHLELYSRHLTERRYLLATHSRRMMEVLLDAYVKSSRSPEAGSVAAGALVELARHLLERGNSHQGREILLRALGHQPDHRTGLLALVAVNELLVDYTGARSAAEKLVAIGPDLAEGWLRLAVNQRRVGAEKAALESFERVMDIGDAPPWILQLAYEELARAHLEDGRPEATVEVVGRALERFPEEQRFYIMAAAAESRRGAVREARDWLHRLDRRLAVRPADALGVGDSPRLRYGDWPEESFAASRAAFAQRSAAGREPLARALLQVAPAEPGSGHGGVARGGGER